LFLRDPVGNCFILFNLMLCSRLIKNLHASLVIAVSYPFHELITPRFNDLAKVVLPIELSAVGFHHAPKSIVPLVDLEELFTVCR